MASSSSSSSSSSTSAPVVMNTPASDFSLNLAQALAHLGQQQYQWAQGEYAKTSQITDQQIQSYLQQSRQAQGLAGNVIDRYTNTYAPNEDQYARDAQGYASDERMRHEMGGAESRAAQAGKAGLDNAEKQLQSFGVDPSSGRYQDLVAAQRTKTAADAAGAGEAARHTVEDQGNQRKVTSMQVGAQLPGAGVNAMNAAYQGLAGAENAALSNANTGANLLNSADPKFQGAMSNKFPPVAQNTTSRSQQQGQSSSPDPSRSQAGAGGHGGGGGSDSFAQPSNYPGAAGGSYGGGSSYGGSRSGGGGFQSNPNSAIRGGFGGEDDYGDPTGGYDPSNAWGTLDQSSQDYGGVLQDNGWGQQFDTGDAGNPYYDPNAGNWGGQDTGYATDSAPQTQDWPDYSTNDSASDYTGDYGYAQGGGVMPEQGGGHVPQSMSPSGGQRTDDIQATIPQTGGRAQLNADEFVIPRDVAMWKGQEFFQSLIKKSREARMGAPAKPTMRPGA